MPRGSGAPVLTLPGSGEAEVILDRAQELSALMTSWELRRGGRHSKASDDLVVGTLLTPLVEYVYH
jgi:hypothetical protein